MRSVFRSVVGMRRKNNEDAVFCGQGNLKDLFIVADGMGGCNAGEVASSLAIKVFVSGIEGNISEYFDDENILDTLVSAIHCSNRTVYELSKTNSEFYGMGTTIDASVIRNSKLYAVHIGDSRIYIFRDGKLKMLTEDHSYVMELLKCGEITEEEARNHPDRNKITRALGTEENILVDTIVTSILPNDIILMCSDGLTNMVSDEKIERILNMNASIDKKADILVDEANSSGGLDNITIILVEQEVEE